MKKSIFEKTVLIGVIVIVLGSFLSQGTAFCNTGYGERIPDRRTPTVDFTADVTKGEAPLTVNFKSLPELLRFTRTYLWDFGDGITSEEKNPSHTYDTTGTYTVSLTIEERGVTATKIKEEYIIVSLPTFIASSAPIYDTPYNTSSNTPPGDTQSGYGDGTQPPSQETPPIKRDTQEDLWEEWGTDGSVRYITGSELLDTSIDCDYLIITHPDFFYLGYLNSFANYRAHYSDFNIVIAKVDDIYTYFPNSNGNDYSIKDFIQYAYNNWQTQPQYLLIVGDAEFVPTPKGPIITGTNGIYSEGNDQWYGCVSGDDAVVDIAIGRFPVKNETHIGNITNKIYIYEQESFSPADSRVLYAGAWNSNWLTLWENRGFEVTQLDTNIDGSYVVVNSDVVNAINNGQNIVYWTDHGAPTGIGTIFNNNDISSLNNSHYPIIFAESCWTADIANFYYESLGEELLRLDKGAVAYYGSYTNSAWQAKDEVMDMILGGEHNLGQAIMKGEINAGMTEHKYILLGDPALQVFGHKLHPELPDLTIISSSDVTYDPKTNQIKLDVANLGKVDANDVLVRVVVINDATGEESSYAEDTLDVVPAGGSTQATLDIAYPGEDSIVVIVDPENQIEESLKVNSQLKIEKVHYTADFDGNGYTDFIDLSVLKQSWLKKKGEPGYDRRADLNKDGIVDILDCNIFDRYWNPLPSTNLTAKAISPHQIELQWLNTAPSMIGFIIERKSSDSEDFVSIYTAGREGRYQEKWVGRQNYIKFYDKGLSSEKRYYYRVRAYSQAYGSGDNVLPEHTSPYSNEAFATTPVNHAPTLESPTSITGREGKSIKFVVKARDEDGNEDLEFTEPKQAELPEGATVDRGKFRTTSGLYIFWATFNWTPTYEQAGVYTVKFSVSDGELTASQSIEITVNDATNQPPKILEILIKFDYYRGEWFLWCLGEDEEDGENLIYSYRIDEGEWSLPNPQPSTGMQEPGLEPGTHLFQVKAIDKEGLESEVKSITFTVP